MQLLPAALENDFGTEVETQNPPQSAFYYLFGATD